MAKRLTRSLCFYVSVVLVSSLAAAVASAQRAPGAYIGMGDFNGDHMTDIFWYNPSTGGTTYLWLMNGTSVTGNGAPPQVSDLNWQIAGIGDFDGDGKADILWRNQSTGENYVWLMNGTSVSSNGPLPTISDPNWHIVGIGDFNGDGKADILWRNTSTGENYLWLMNGLSVQNSGPLPTISDQNWQIVGVADFNNDGNADILWRNSGTFAGENYMWLMNGLSIASNGPLPPVDQTWQVVGVGKFNGASNGAGILWRRSTSGENYMWLMNGLTTASNGPLPQISDLNWQIAGIGDFNGDGKADILWRNNNTGDLYMWLMNGLTVAANGPAGHVLGGWTIPSGLPPLFINTFSLPSGVLNGPYSASVNTSGSRTGTVIFTVTSGALPAWATLENIAGLIHGTPNATGTTNFTITATDSGSPAQTASQALSITINTASNNAELNGHYAFLVQGYDKNVAAIAMAGSFTADGSGNLTNGIYDINNQTTGVSTSQAFTGTYLVGPDQRGTMTFSTGQTFAFSLGSFTSGVSALAYVIEWDSSGTCLTGIMKKQTTSAFTLGSITGNYAFGAAGVDIGPNRFGIAGVFTADGSGNVSSGQADINDNGTVNFGSGLASPISFIGTYTAPSASNRRATVTLTFPGPTTFHEVIYVVSAGEFFDIGIDAVSSTTALYGGSILKQGGTRPFNNGSTTGTAVYYRVGQGWPLWPTTHVIGGLYTPDGNGNYTATYDISNGAAAGVGGAVSSGSVSGTYSVASNGRITYTGGEPQVSYLANSSVAGAFTLSADNIVGFGPAIAQAAGPFSNASVSGNYIAGRVAPGMPGGRVESDAVTADGNGHITGTGYEKEYENGVLGSFVPNPQVDYLVSSNGRAPGLTSVFYVISPSKAVMIDLLLWNVFPTATLVDK